MKPVHFDTISNRMEPFMLLANSKISSFVYFVTQSLNGENFNLFILNCKSLSFCRKYIIQFLSYFVEISAVWVSRQMDLKFTTVESWIYMSFQMRCWCVTVAVVTLRWVFGTNPVLIQGRSPPAVGSQHLPHHLKTISELISVYWWRVQVSKTFERKVSFMN